MKKILSNEDPQNIEMEKSLLGSMLLKDGEIIPDISNILYPSDFYRPEHRLLYQAILDLHKSGKPISLVTFMELLRSSHDDNGKSLLDSIGLDYILAITQASNTTAYAEHYAKQIKEKATYRYINHMLEAIQDKVSTQQPLDEVVENFQIFSDIFTSRLDEINGSGFSNFADDEQIFKRDIDLLKSFKDRHTGFFNIDLHQFLLPGLYVLGATPACGKTTFAWQLACQLAESGENCLFCSYEMTPTELYSKSAARELFKLNPHTFITAADIRQGAWTDNLNAVYQDMKSSMKNLKVKKFSDESVDKLLFNLRPFCIATDKKPIIFIDYLQRLIPRNGKADTRTLIDDALFKIKDFQQKYNVTFIVISTFNRTNYNNLVSFESFKESGGIEYTADVVWAMQLNVANYLSGEKEFTIRKKINDAKKNQPREINLTCLKNRNGNNYDCYFKYYSAHDYFVPCDESDFIISNPAAISDNADDDNEK